MRSCASTHRLELQAGGELKHDDVGGRVVLRAHRVGESALFADLVEERELAEPPRMVE